MIIDNLENCKLYFNLNQKFSQAFNFLINNDLKKMELGKHLIDGEDIFALVQEYNTKEIKDGNLEGHFKYIDIQYIIKGSELIGVALLKNHQQICKNEEEDYAFYGGEKSFLQLEEGMFAVFFPSDLHMPCLKIDKASKVKKVVIKIKL